jgi:hypothetical protein
VNEKALLLQISRIANKAASFRAAVEGLGALLEAELGCKGLIVNQPDEPRGDKARGDRDAFATCAEHFFQETAHLPARSLYTVALRANGQELGRLIAFFAGIESSTGIDASDGLPQRVVTFAGEQLGLMLERLRLAKRRKQLRTEVAKIRYNLATRKAIHRAEGILAKRGMNPETARMWLRREAERQGLSALHVANELFDREVQYVPEPSSVEISLSAAG